MAHLAPDGPAVSPGRSPSRCGSKMGQSGRSMGLITEAIELQMQQLMDDWHFRMVQSTLGRTWSQEDATKAVLTLFQLNGIEITDSEINEMSSYVDDSYLVSDLVEKLNPAQREDVESTGSYFLSLLDTTAALRRAVDDGGDPEAIQKVVEETDSCPMGQAVLKQAVIEASKEVAQIYHNQDTWVTSMGKRLDRLQRSAEFAAHAQQQLMAVETQLENFAGEQSNKSKSALQNLAHENDKTLMHGVFAAWNGICQFGAGERAIKAKYEKLAAKAEDELVQYKERRIANVKRVLMRNARETGDALVRFVVEKWHNYAQENKRDGTTKEKMMELEAKLKDMSDRSSANATKVMARLGAESDEQWLAIAFGAWTKFHEDYAKDRELEDAVKKAEQSFKNIMDKQKGDTQKIIASMHGSSQNGLMNMVLLAWHHHVVEIQKESKMLAEMNAKGANFSSLNSKSKNSAMNARGRVNNQVKLNVQSRCFCAWLMESRINHMTLMFEKKLKHKRDQLSSVQGLFKSFAKQLEEGLSNLDGESSSRTTRTARKGMHRDQASVSLPDIHARQGVAA